MNNPQVSEDSYSYPGVSLTSLYLLSKLAVLQSISSSLIIKFIEIKHFLSP